MAKFRKKPVVIEAVRWTNKGLSEVPQWISDALNKLMPLPDEKFNPERSGAITRVGHDIHIATMEGIMIASRGDYIIRGVNGELYPCKPDIFEKTYEDVTP